MPNSDVANFLEVVAAVLNALPSPTLLPLAHHLVGLEESSTLVINMLHKMGDNLGVIGIWGMAGIGKTTLAYEIHNQEQSKFDSGCSLKDVKEAKDVTILNPQIKMVTKLVHVNAKKLHWDFVHCLGQFLKKKVLVIDDNYN